MQEVMNQLMLLSQDMEVIKAYILAQGKSKAENLKDSWIDNQDVMQTLHISKRNLQTLRDNGTLPFSRINQKIYYKVADIEAILEGSYSQSKSVVHGTK